MPVAIPLIAETLGDAFPGRSIGTRRLLVPDLSNTPGVPGFPKGVLVDRAGFEPAYACAGRFTVCCL